MSRMVVWLVERNEERKRGEENWLYMFILLYFILFILFYFILLNYEIFIYLAYLFLLSYPFILSVYLICLFYLFILSVYLIQLFIRTLCNTLYFVSYIVFISSFNSIKLKLDFILLKSNSSCRFFFFRFWNTDI